MHARPEWRMTGSPPAEVMAARAEFIDTDDPRWRVALGRVRHDIYHLAQYVDFASRRQFRGEPTAVVVNDGDGMLFVPLIIRDLPEPLVGTRARFDATTPRFYPGPLLHTAEATDAEVFVDRAVRALRVLLADRDIVSLYVRMHPLFTPHLHAFERHGSWVEHSDSVSLDLQLSEEQLWGQMRANHRRDINRAQRNGYRFRVDSEWRRLADFVEVYGQSMQRLAAEPSWRLSVDWFDELLDHVGGHLHLGVVELGDDLACAAILTEIDGLVEYHLAASSDAHFGARPSKLFIHEAGRWAKARGNDIFHLAGSKQRGDGLHHFKTGFSRSIHPMASWRVVTDHGAYAEVVQRWQDLTSRATDPPEGYFPAYRTPSDGQEAT